MDNPTARNDWRTVLKEQGRTIAWLADQTGKSRRTVYGYSRGQLPPTPQWLAAASRVLGVEVTA
jgi:predicted transcriptional regulator